MKVEINLIVLYCKSVYSLGSDSRVGNLYLSLSWSKLLNTF